MIGTGNCLKIVVAVRGGCMKGRCGGDRKEGRYVWRGRRKEREGGGGGGKKGE